MVGRALSLYQTATYGGMAAGSWLWGELADVQGVSGAFLVASVVLVIGGIMGIVLRQPDFETLNLDPTNKFSEPTLQLDLRPRSGPIMVMVDYRIDQRDVPEFLSVMTSWRKARLRDGARQWALLRDLEKPELWTECYHVPTWIEYVRHNNRRNRCAPGSAAPWRLRAQDASQDRTPNRARARRFAAQASFGQDLSWPGGLSRVTLSR